ncbi:hypothetical protein AAFF_G00233890 [Aldrovandia affinis]|uniref:Uncharacterized protein n=1 Tax=Aldrovandia affinis TaxID=143900 RepID=A0AAD7REW3_9TELE|nr:hypothetical protein AAFF_G00233890 [Aldrovandia affinis]
MKMRQIPHHRGLMEDREMNETPHILMKYQHNNIPPPRYRYRQPHLQPFLFLTTDSIYS